jgi:hypothetical protein
MTKWNDHLNRVTTLAWLHCERWLVARAAQIKEALRRCKYLFVTDPRAPNLYGYRWEYSPLAHYGNLFWARILDPALRLFADDTLAAFRRTRGIIQVILVIAILLIPAAFFFHPGHLLTASGLLFDIAGVLRLFLFDELQDALEPFKKREHIPSVAMRELIMPEGSGPYTAESPHISMFYYRKRGVLFLFIGFALQMAGDILG